MPRKQRFKPSRKPKPPVDQAPPTPPIDAPLLPPEGAARASKLDRADPAPASPPPASDLPSPPRDEGAAP